MNILVISRSYDQRIGGMETHTHEVVNGLAKNHKVHVLTPELIKDRFFIEDVDVIRVSKMPNKYTKYSFIYWYKVQRYLRKNDHDVIVNISMSIGGIVHYPSFLKKKTVTILHGTYRNERRTQINAYKRKHSLISFLGIFYTIIFEKLEYLTIKRSSKVITVSEGIYNQLRNTYKPFKDKFELINNFVDTNIFSYKERDFKMPLNILFLSRMHREKGIYEFVNAIDILRSKYLSTYNCLKFNIAGGGPEFDEINLKVKDLKLDNVTLLGTIVHDDVAGIYYSNDIYVFPNTGHEATPFSLLEAMGTGMPVISSAGTGPYEIVKKANCGVIVPIINGNNIANTIMKIINNRSKLIIYSKNSSRATSQDYNRDIQLDKIISIIENIK